MKEKSKKDRVITDHGAHYIEQDQTLSPAIIVDIDGTIALIEGRSPFDETKWHTDTPHNPIISLIEYAVTGICAYKQDEKAVTILFITGREGGKKNEEKIWEWIEFHTDFGQCNSKLFTRQPGDHRGDVDVKGEIYANYVKDKYNVYWVFEDRNKMVNFWRNEIQLPTLQVKDGDY